MLTVSRFILCEDIFQKAYLFCCLRSANDTSIVENDTSIALLGLRQFLASESSLRNMKNAFYFNLKALFVLKMIKFLSSIFDHVGKRLN